MSGLPMVTRVEWLTTRRCDLSCGYCAIRFRPPRLGPELNAEQALRVVDFLAERWPGAPVNFFGGEPTVRKDLPALIRRMRELGQMVILSSNSVKAYKDPEYRRELVKAGITNWTISLDGLSPDHCIDRSTWLRCLTGLDVLEELRREGVQDLVVNITATKKNLYQLPRMVEAMTRRGYWSIICMLQLGHPGYEYSQGNREDLPTQDQIKDVYPQLAEMARSGKYLLQTSGDWFEFLVEHGVEDQTWKCNDKASLTIDADGSLKHCVDVPMDPTRWKLHLFDLDNTAGQEEYDQRIHQPPPCEGCLWDSAFDSIRRGRTTLGEAEARRLYRHELDEEQISRLLPEAQQWFRRKP